MYHRYHMKTFLESITNNRPNIVLLAKGEDVTICSQVLAAKTFIDLSKPVVVTSCTQVLEWDANSFLYSLANPVVDGGLVTFQNTHPRYWYLDSTDEGWVSDCEKGKQITTNASAGVFYWKRAHDLFKYASIALVKGKDTVDKFGVLMAYKVFPRLTFS
jgi:hypothetical protein